MDFRGQNRLFAEIDPFSAEANNQYQSVIIIIIIIITITIIVVIFIILYLVI